MAYHSAAADHDKAAVMVVNISVPDFDTAFVQGKWYLMIKNYPQKSHKNMKMPLLKAILCVEEYRFEKSFLSDFAFEVQMLPKSNFI